MVWEYNLKFEFFFQILKFDTITSRDQFFKKLTEFFKNVGVKHGDPGVMSEKTIFKHANTKVDRQKLLEKFFRVTFAHVSDTFFGQVEITVKNNPGCHSDINNTSNPDLILCTCSVSVYMQNITLVWQISCWKQKDNARKNGLNHE